MEEKIYPLSIIPATPPPRFTTGIDGLDQVLGGGLVTGSTVLTAGTPGSGKSTLLTQLSYQLAQEGKKVLYIAGEENKEQIKMRAERMGINSDSIFLVEDTEVEMIKEVCLNIRPEVVIVDSLQMLYSKLLKQSPGSPSQMKNGLMILCHLAKKEKITFIFVGHSTKGGYIAGLQSFQHMVDVVLYLGLDEENGNLRFLKANKNRFGSIDFIWQNIHMTEYGLFDNLKEAKPAYQNKTYTFTSTQLEKLVKNHALVGPFVKSSLNWLEEEAKKKKVGYDSDNGLVLTQSQVLRLVKDHPVWKPIVNLSMNWISNHVSERR